MKWIITLLLGITIGIGIESYLEEEEREYDAKMGPREVNQ